MKRWLVLPSGPGEAAWNMAVDEMLLEFASAMNAPVLRLYGWEKPAATFGYFQKHGEISSWTGLRPLIRRPTGGGLVPHDRDWTYSVIAPPGDEWFQLRAEESYRRVHEWVRLAFESLQERTELSSRRVKEAPGRCFAGAEKFDLLWQGQKIAGAAQRRNKLGLLIQGSVQNPSPGVSRGAWEEGMLGAATSEWGAGWEELKLTPAMSERAEQLRAGKYSLRDYNQRR